jgi:hypothetical protein
MRVLSLLLAPRRIGQILFFYLRLDTDSIVVLDRGWLLLVSTLVILKHKRILNCNRFIRYLLQVLGCVRPVELQRLTYHLLGQVELLQFTLGLGWLLIVDLLHGALLGLILGRGELVLGAGPTLRIRR